MTQPRLHAVDTTETDPPGISQAVSPIPEIVAELKAGRMVFSSTKKIARTKAIWSCAADFVTPDAINFMAKHGRGLICLTLTEARCRQLDLAPMVSAIVPCTARISRFDRGRRWRDHGHFGRGSCPYGACRGCAHAKPSDIVQPGHIFPLMAQPGGVLARAGHTEAGCDLTELAALTPAAVICEILKDDGSMARLPDLVEFARDPRPQDRCDHRSYSLSQSDRTTYRARRRALDQYGGR